MSHLTKLMLAVGLALSAAGLNALWLSAEKTPTLFLAAKADLPKGKEITDDMLAPIPVPGDADRLRAALIPYANRAILYGLKTSRDYQRGDMFFQRDIQAPTEVAKFEVLGPFRLISVGERFKQPTAEREETAIDRGGNNVTIAVSADFDDKTRQLLQIINPDDDADDEDAQRIVAVQVVPPEQQSSVAAQIEQAGDRVVYQTVPLDGIENVPQVLLAGEVIRFVVPASTAF